MADSRDEVNRQSKSRINSPKSDEDCRTHKTKVTNGRETASLLVYTFQLCLDLFGGELDI